MAVGGASIGASLAIGELSLGPEMIPAALLTLLLAGVGGGMGAASGAEEDAERQKQRDTVAAQLALV